MLRIGDYDLYESMYDVVFFLFKAHLPISQIEKIFLNIFKFQMFCLLLLLLLCGLKWIEKILKMLASNFEIFLDIHPHSI